jgi:hypothetical protein
MANVAVSWQVVTNTLSAGLTGAFEVQRLDGAAASGADKDGRVAIGYYGGANTTSAVDQFVPLPVNRNPAAPISYRVCALTDGYFKSVFSDLSIFATCSGESTIRPSVSVGHGPGGVVHPGLNNLLIPVPSPNRSGTGGWLRIRRLVHKPSAAKADAKPQ